MARNNDRGGSSRRAPKDAGRRIKKKPCALCKDRVEWVDYKDVAMLRKYMSDRGKIRARRVSGNCTQHQRDVAIAIKTARELVLLPYTQRTTTERPGGRGRGRMAVATGRPVPVAEAVTVIEVQSSEGRPAAVRHRRARGRRRNGCRGRSTGAEAERRPRQRPPLRRWGTLGLPVRTADNGVAEPAAASEVGGRRSGTLLLSESGGDDG